MSVLPEDKYSGDENNDEMIFDPNELVDKREFEDVGEGEGLDEFDTNELVDKREFEDVGEGLGEFDANEVLKYKGGKRKRKTKKRRYRYTKHKRCKNKKCKTKRRRNKRKSRRK
jgi:hypothetical protein